jgi:tRNA 2-thiocytidine biosynthesis protein TtcA
LSNLVSLGGRRPKPSRALFEGRKRGSFRFATKLERTLVKKTADAIVDFGLIGDGDRVMVCVSGGKDSYALLDVLRILQRRAPVRFELVAVNIDQGWPGYDTAQIRDHLVREGVEHHMEVATYAKIVEEKLEPGQTPCTLCSRFRRAYLYDLAPRLGCTKIALGHHLDDMIETLMLNLMFSGRLASMPPLLHAEDGRNTVIRPLAYVSEADTRGYSLERGYPVVRCGCLSCGLPDQKRQVVKRLLAGLEADHPNTKRQMLAAMQNVKPSHLLDRDLWARLGLGGAKEAAPAGSKQVMEIMGDVPTSRPSADVDHDASL